MDGNRWPKLLLNAIFTTASTGNLKWNWLRQIKSVLVDCGMDRVLNMDSPTHPQWTSTFENIYKVADNNGWYTRALEKSSLANYLKFKIVPSLETYLLDKINLSGCALKFKARTNKHHVRDEAYNSLREALLNNNWEVLWDMFTQGDTDTKQFLLY